MKDQRRQNFHKLEDHEGSRKNILAMEGELEKDWRKKERKGVGEEKREGREKSFFNLERERDEDNGIFLPQNQINIPSS